MESKNGGIEEVVQDYVKESVPADRECEGFGVNLAAFLDLMEKLKAEGRVGGVIPVEVADPEIAADDLAGIGKKFAQGLPEEGTEKNPLMVPVIGAEEGKLRLKVFPYHKDARESRNEIAEGARVMSMALKYLHASPERRGSFPRVYEFLKSFVLAFGDDARPAVNPARVDVFLSSVPMELSEELVEKAYDEAYGDGKTQTIIRGMMGVKDVTADGFRAWMDSFEPQRFQDAWMQRLKVIIAEKKKEMSQKAVNSYMNRILDKNRVGSGSILASAELKTRAHSAETTGGGGERAAVEAVTQAVRAYRIIDVDENPAAALTDKQRERAEKALSRLADMMNAHGGGIKFGFLHYNTVCELIFGDTLRWMSASGIEWETLLGEGYAKPFEAMDKGKDEDLYFFSGLYSVRSELEKNGLRTTGVRELFIKGLPCKTGAK